LRSLLHYIVFFLIFVFSCTSFAFDLEKDVHEYKLPNGMKWLLVPRHLAPVFSGAVMIRVGGADETPGKTGLAHMFEHMAFKGSSKLGTTDFSKEKPILNEIEKAGEEFTLESRKPKPDVAKVKELAAKLAALQKQASQYQIKNEVWEVMIRNGAADLNAFTSKDVTAYHASMPINRLELFLDVISQMVADSVYREFYTERSVILEERRGGVDNDPEGKMSELLMAAAFKEGPYHWPVIGSVEDVAGLTIADARAFHDRFYVADNMVGVLVGDFSLGEAKDLIKRYFGDIHSSKEPRSTANFTNKGGITEKFSFDAEPSVAMAYHKPTLPDPIEFTFDVISVLLCDGPTSRLEKRLIYDEKIAREVSCSDSYPGSRFNNLMLIWMEPNRPHTNEELVAKVTQELNRLKTEPISDEELQRVRTRVTADMLYGLEKNMGLAVSLAEFEAIFGDWRLISKYPKLVEAVTKEDIMKVANEYFEKGDLVEVIRVKSATNK
jgi:predicted Zn-dependent peptidase